MADSVLPVFPNFAPLSLVQQTAIEEISSQFDPYSDFAFSNLWAWDIDGSTLVTTLNGNLVYRLTDYDKDIRFFTLIGQNNLDETVHTLIEHAKESGDETSLMFVPEVVALGVTDPNFRVEEDRDNHDYIYSVADLVEFSKSKYSGKKYILEHFKKLYSDQLEVRIFNSDLPIAELKDFFYKWQKARNKSDEDVSDELKAFDRVTKISNSIGLNAFCLYIEGSLVGYIIFEVLSHKTAIIHFDKALVNYKGIYEFMKHSLAKHLAGIDIELINYEQDLGIPGLRQAKESFRPVKFLKKYTISLAE